MPSRIRLIVSQMITPWVCDQKTLARRTFLLPRFSSTWQIDSFSCPLALSQVLMAQQKS